MSLWPSISSNLDRLQTDAGDPLLNIYFFEHVFNHFSEGNIFDYRKFWSPDFFWPVKGTYAWSDHLIGPSLIYSTWRLIYNQYESYLAWLGTTLFLNYISIRWALVRISPKSLSYWVSLSTLVCCFSPIILSQLGHPQILSLYIFGPILYGCNKLLTCNIEEITYSELIGLSSWLLVNGIFNIYLFVFGFFVFLIALGLHLLKRFQQNNLYFSKGKYIKKKLVGLLVLIAVNLTLYIPYLNTINTFGKRGIGMIINNLPKVNSWIYSSDLNLLPAPITPGSLGSQFIVGVEQELFPGWIFLILVVAAFLTGAKASNSKIRKNNVRMWMYAVSLSFLLSLNIFGISLWRVFTYIIPGANAVGASSRVSLIIILFCAPLFAHASIYWNYGKLPFEKIITSIVVISIGFASIWRVKSYNFNLSSWKNQLAVIVKAVQTNNCNSFWIETEHKNTAITHIKAMHAQIQTGIPTLNGYSGQEPKGGYPFSQGTGESAYSWSIAVKSIKSHNTKFVDTLNNNCVVNVHNNLATVRKLSKEDLSLDKVDFAHSDLKIIEANDNKIYFKRRQGNIWSEILSIPVKPKKNPQDKIKN